MKSVEGKVDNILVALAKRPKSTMMIVLIMAGLFFAGAAFGGAVFG